MIAIGCDHAGIVRTMGRLTQKPLDVHLMVENPLPFIPELAEERWNGSPSITKSPAARKKPCGPSGKQVCRLDWS